jgi:hypothetical protein
MWPIVTGTVAYCISKGQIKKQPPIITGHIKKELQGQLNTPKRRYNESCLGSS